jgi:hypothetical protein
MSETDHDAMVRWQGYSREQRSTVNSLFLTYAAALLGLQSSILLSREVARVDVPWLFVAAGGGALLSLTAGCVVVLVRLHARLTARIARFRVEKKSSSDIDGLRRSTDKLGKWTNRLIPSSSCGFCPRCHCISDLGGSLVRHEAIVRGWLATACTRPPTRRLSST